MIVRWLADPLPRAALARMGEAINPAWERSVRDRLLDCYRNAARPAHGVVPAGAPAVVFSDEAEMLACLIHDAAAHNASTLWWWSRVPRPGNTWDPATIAAAEPRVVPAAFAQLAMRNEIAAVLAAISPRDSDRLADLLLAAYDAPPIVKDRAPLRGSFIQGGLSPSDTVPQPLTPAPAWAERIFACSVAPRLGPERERLLATAMLLHHDPTSVRLSAIHAALSAGPAVYVAEVSAVPWPVEQSGTATHPVADDPRDTGTPDAASSSFVADAAGQSAAMASLPNASKALPRPSDVKKEAPASPASPPSAARVTPASSVLPVEPSAGVSPVSGLEDGVVTALSGVLYLVNLLRALNLPQCFAGTWRLPERINSWGLLEAIARGLIAHADAHPIDDPIWHALASLGGRELHQPLGEGIAAMEDFDLPVPWMTAWRGAATDPYAYGVHVGRFHVWSRAGFILGRRRFDSPESKHAAIAREILRNYFDDVPTVALAARPADEIPLDRLAGPLAANLGTGLRDWLGLALPYIRQRLARSLGAEPGQIAQTLLHHRGRLFVTQMHVDLVLPMSSIHIAVRRSGLDVDPGWVPELGRIIKFHFE
jgi:hypothetical protein